MTITDSVKQEIVVNQVESYINGNISDFRQWINTTNTRNVLLAIKLLDSQYQPLNTGIDIVLSLLD